MNDGQMAGRVQIAGTIEYRDKDGNIIKQVPFTGSLPMNQEEEHGDDCERVQESGA